MRACGSLKCGWALSLCMMGALSACDVQYSGDDSSGGLPLVASDVSGAWTLEVDTSDAARAAFGDTGGISVSVSPSAADIEDGSRAADEGTLRYRILLETEADGISRCTAQDLMDQDKYVSVSCALARGALRIVIGSEENGGVIKTSLARNAIDDPITGKTVMSAAGLPMDVVIGRASLVR